MFKNTFFNKAESKGSAPESVQKIPEANVEGNIISAIKGEHKYTLMMVSVIKEQLAEYDIGKTPDYNLMYDVMGYMGEFPKKFNQPLKIKFISAVINKSPENSQDLEDLLAEKRQIVDFNKQVTAALKSVIKSHSILKEEEMKIFSKNYIELLESHINIESKILFLRAESLLSSEELADFDKADKSDIQRIFEQDVAHLFEEKYKDVSDEMHKRWVEIEDVANDFALAEFISLGALFESIEPITLSAAEISRIIKECSYNMFLANRKCYKDLFTSVQEQPRSYIDKPVNTAKDCYDEYVSGVDQIGEVLKKAKTQVYDNYASGKELISGEGVNAPTSKPSAATSEPKADKKAAPVKKRKTAKKTATSKVAKADKPKAATPKTSKPKTAKATKPKAVKTAKPTVTKTTAAKATTAKPKVSKPKTTKTAKPKAAKPELKPFEAELLSKVAAKEVTKPKATEETS